MNAGEYATGAVLEPVIVTGEVAALDAEVRRLDEIGAAYDDKTLSDNTKRAYGSAWNEFQAFCGKFGFTPLPADPITVRRFVTECATSIKEDGTPRLSVASIKQKISAIGWFHLTAGALDPTTHKTVANLVKGIARDRVERPRRKRPLLLADMEVLIEAMPHDEYPHGVSAARDALALWLGWAGAMRRSEVAALTIGQVEFHALDGLHITVGKSKANQEGVQPDKVAIPYGSKPTTCVPCAMHRWLRLVAIGDDRRAAMRALYADDRGKHICRGANPTLDSDGAPLPGLEPHTPLMRATYRNRHNAQIEAEGVSGSALNEMLQTRLAEAGYDPTPYGFHSLRAGFVTQARRNGAPNRGIQNQGRWKSAQMLDVYDREWNPMEGNAVQDLGL